MTVEATVSPLDEVGDGECDDAADHAALVGFADEAPALDGHDVGLDHEVARCAHVVQ